MTEDRKKRGAGEGHASPAGPAKKKRNSKVIPGTGEGEPTERRPPQIRVVAQDERLTPDERKRRFARNLDRLIGLVGLSRVDAAHEIGVRHKLVLRLVNAGVSRTDDRNTENLTRIAAYFALPSVTDLWSVDLLQLVLSADRSSGFVEKFRPRLLAEREKRLAEARARSHEELALLSRALGFDSEPPSLTGPIAEKIIAILASPKGEQFKRVVEDYFELAQGQIARSDRG